jgi:hypothetical protein
MHAPRKSQSHGKIGEAAVYAKCWMHGIPAYFTGGLRNNFAGSDLIVETPDPRRKLWLQVKTGAPTLREHVYLTQCKGPEDLEGHKFSSDFVVFVNIDQRTALAHQHAGELSFEHLSYYVVPRDSANDLYSTWLHFWLAKPKRDGQERKLGNMAMYVPAENMRQYRDAWHLISAAAA